MTTWVRFGKGRSWHVAMGENRTRCGRKVRVPFETCAQPAVDEKSCNSCATLALGDEAA